MRHKTAQMGKSGILTLMTALALGAGSMARAQLPVFDTVDWTMDRGYISAGGSVGLPATPIGANAYSPGYNGYMITDPAAGPPSSVSLLNNNPGPAVPRWVFPRTSDLVPGSPTLTSATIIVDNETRTYLEPPGTYAVPPAPFPDDPDYPNGDYITDAAGNRVRSIPLPPGVFNDGSYDPQQLAHMRTIATTFDWTLPDVVPGTINPVTGAILDYRSEGGLGGYSINSDPTLPWDYDYLFTPAVYNPFIVNRSDGTVSPATSAEIAQLPYGSQDVVSSINSTLNGTSNLRAFYSMGAYNAAAGNYAVDVWMPGDGTTINGVAHPSISRAFVRVSWGTFATDGVNNTINADGSFNTGVIQQLVNSRIFLVDQEGPGWYSLAAPGQVETAIPYDGTPADQIVVEVYTLTPDDVNPGDPNSQYGQTPVITADAVRFRPVLLPTSGGLGLGTISASGKIIAPAAITPKFTPLNSPDVQPTEVQPFIYIGREEIVPNPTAMVPENPLLPVDPNPYLPPPALPGTPNPNYNPLVSDPTATMTVPVFYCIDNQNGNAQFNNVQITSIDKVRWRYQGLPDSNDTLIDGSNTTVSAPLLANVRCRDGVTRPMVFFTQTNADDSLGRVYAFDPVGVRALLTTNLYWVYPSYRPITAADNNTNGQFAGAYYEYHDPNYKNIFAGVGGFGLQYNPGTYPTTSFGGAGIADQAIGLDHYYDGEVSPNTASPGTWQVSTNNTQIAAFGGITASPLLINDPANPGGPQLLIVPSTNGRVYAFDAGGRGDYSPITTATPLPGTTQRLWTYPHFGADAYHYLGYGNVGAPTFPPTNFIQDEPNKVAFSQTPAFDPNYVNNNPAGDPFFLPAEDGYYYAINPIRDTIGIPAVLGSQQANWNDAARLNWQYPAAGATPLLNPQNGAYDSSPVTIFSPTAGGNLLYFTAVGHVFCLPEVTLTAANVPNWIFPYTPDPPYDNVTDTVFYEFNGMPPLAVRQANLPGSTADELFMLDNTSTIYMLDPLGTIGGGATTLQAYGQTITGSNTSSAPILSQLQMQQQYSPTGALGIASQPALVFGDEQGSVWGLSASAQTINGNVIPALTIIWSQFDSSQSRDANVVLGNGMLISGSEDGQLRAYGIGNGPDEDTGTLGTGEPAQHTPGIGTLSVDLRTLNVYAQSDWNSMELGPTGTPPTPPYGAGKRETPMRDENGNALTNSANPLTANVTSTNIVAVDWGDNLYVAAAGVYHAQPTDPTQVVYSTGPPTISVVFTLTQPDASPVTYPLGSAQGVIAPGYIPATGLTPAYWPDDLGITAGEHNNLKIYGLDSADGTYKTLTGPTNNVYPWVAKIKIPISPSGSTPFSPGLAGYKLTAVATIQQNVTQGGQTTQAVYTSNYLGLGQPNWTGFDLTPGASGNITIPNPNTLPAGRSLAVTNPIALTVRSYVGTGSTDMTGSNNPNIIGWMNSVELGGNNIGEILGTGNNQAIPGLATAGIASPLKDLFAPIGLGIVGSTMQYQAINGTGQAVPAMDVADRTALSRMNGNKSFQIQVVAGAPHWFGNASSVMNPLPWEIMPTSNSITTTGTADYPGFNPNTLSITANGQDAINTLVTLNTPWYNDTNPIQNPNMGDPITTRLMNPVPMSLSISVPQYQPANVNRGITKSTLWDGTTFNFGQGLTGISGITHGLNVATDPVIGPMQTVSGLPVAPGNALAFPAAGYVSNISVTAVPPSTGTNGGVTVTNVRLSLLLGRAGTIATGFGTATPAFRDMMIGLTVAPSIKLRTVETTVDLGKQPEGAGYSAYVAGAFQIPFAPTGTAPYYLLNYNGGPNVYAPWDNPYSNTLTEMFQPFTLISESNVNLINLRAAKVEATLASGPVGPYSRSVIANIASNNPVSLKFSSDQVNNLSISPLIALPFLGITEGNLGLVTSFDHYSSSSNPITPNPNYSELSLWPILNPYVYLQDIQSINTQNASLITTDSLGKGVVGWFPGLQPQPTIGKPRVGDAVGHTATIPDAPHDAPVNQYTALIQDPTGTATPTGGTTPSGGNTPYITTSYFGLPKIGLAVPMGTPVGTYYNPVNFYEDNTPPQWAEWLAASGANYVPGISNNGVLDVTPAGAPLETYTNPTFTLKETVREARLTGGFTAGTLPMVDSGAALNTNGFPGGSTMPAVYMAPGGGTANTDPRSLVLFWSTDRLTSGQSPLANAPWELAYSSLSTPYALIPNVYPPVFSDAGFFAGDPGSSTGGQAADGTNILLPNLGAWWSTPQLFNGFGTGGTGSGATISYLFPDSPTQQAAATIGSFVPPLMAGTPNANTTRMINPAVAPALNVTAGYGNYTVDTEAYLFWSGQIDKTGTGSDGGTSVSRDTRTFWQLLGTTAPTQGLPVGPTYSMLNDPAVIKLSPKPLLVKLPAANGAPQEKYLYVFWHASSGTSTQIYYNVASSTRLGLGINAPFNPSAQDIWTTDAQLPLPGSLVSESDPYPTYRHVWSAALGEFVDAIDVAFTGVLKNRQKVEVLLARYMINRSTSTGALGALTLMPLPTVSQETLSRVGTTNTFASRDAFWAMGAGPNGTLLTTDNVGFINIQLLQGATGQLSTLNYQYTLNPTTNAFVSSNGLNQLGTFDPASGLVTYNALSLDPVAFTPVPGISGGQIVVDIRSGTVSFPQVAPQINDAVLVSYTPYMMRLSTSRDETNIIRSSLIGTAWVNDPSFAVRPAANSPGSNAVPVIILDRGVNPRVNLTAPVVMFNGATNTTELDRLWVLYRKSDPSGSVKSTIYYKAMRLMVKLPRPFGLTAPNANGQQFLAAAPTITASTWPVGPYEVDWVRGRIYFTEQDEGNQITVNYTYYNSTSGANATSGPLTYTVAWGDEMSSASSNGDDTLPERPLPTDQAVNEGQVAAFKDPYEDKLWIFWTSTRSNTTDLYYETIAPQLYPTASNQQ